MMWFGQTPFKRKRFDTSLGVSVNHTREQSCWPILTWLLQPCCHVHSLFHTQEESKRLQLLAGEGRKVAGFCLCSECVWQSRPDRRGMHTDHRCTRTQTTCEGLSHHSFRGGANRNLAFGNDVKPVDIERQQIPGGTDEEQEPCKCVVHTSTSEISPHCWPCWNYQALSSMRKSLGTRLWLLQVSPENHSSAIPCFPENYVRVTTKTPLSQP